MFPKEEIDGFEKYWRRRKPGSSTAVHYASDVRIFFKWIAGRKPESITMHDVDGFIEWQQSLGRAPATIRRRLIALRMFFDYLAYICEQQIPNPVVAQRHYVDKGHRLPRDIRQEDLEKLFVAIGDHQRDRTIFTLMLHTGVRVGEVVNLHLTDVFLHEDRKPHLRVNGKGQRERIVYLSAAVAQLMNEYLLVRSPRNTIAIGQVLSPGAYLGDLSPVTPYVCLRNDCRRGAGYFCAEDVGTCQFTNDTAVCSDR